MSIGRPAASTHGQVIDLVLVEQRDRGGQRRRVVQRDGRTVRQAGDRRARTCCSAARAGRRR
jgi:hypothetical protein